MVDQWILKILLSPLALLYGLVISARNGLYNLGVLRGISFSIPVISIGNLSVGGAGKTPHTEYLIRLLHEYIKIGVLSRGYRRKTTGYREVLISDDSINVGDEPLQFKRKFPHVPVAVSESRGMAIPLLVRTYPDMQLILLDDGFQHREVDAGMQILLTDFNQRFTKDWLLPVGKLREWRSASGRADVIIVTKSPMQMSRDEMDAVRKEVMHDADQKIFFTYYAYGNPYRMYRGGERIMLNDNMKVVLVAGLADTSYLLEYVKSKVDEVLLVEFGDHHQYSSSDIHDIGHYFKSIQDTHQSIILTTEKDAMRLDSHRELLKQLDLPVYLLPIQVQFLEEAEEFDEYIKEWLLNFKR